MNHTDREEMSMFITEHHVHGVLIDVYVEGRPYTRRHEAILAGAKPEWGLDGFSRRITGATSYGEIQKGRDTRFIAKRAGKKK
jgi:hypothetical protein